MNDDDINYWDFIAYWHPNGLKNILKYLKKMIFVFVRTQTSIPLQLYKYQDKNTVCIVILSFEMLYWRWSIDCDQYRNNFIINVGIIQFTDNYYLDNNCHPTLS